jgi:6-pyruvoyltetrahydropterin/6-carboxytetrahydropterin synthase
MIIFKHFTFDSAHCLPRVPIGHKCEEIHGHTYKLTVFVKGEVMDYPGWVLDFSEISSVVKSVLEHVDHKMLNAVPGLENPTCERLAEWLWNKIKPQIGGLSKIELYETPTSGVIYEPVEVERM